jgi:hypothetical protein
MRLGKNHSVRIPEVVDAYLESLRAERGPGTKMSEIIRPILWEWYKSEMDQVGKKIKLPKTQKTPKAKAA